MQGRGGGGRGDSNVSDVTICGGDHYMCEGGLDHWEASCIERCSQAAKRRPNLNDPPPCTRTEESVGKRWIMRIVHLYSFVFQKRVPVPFVNF